VFFCLHDVTLVVLSTWILFHCTNHVYTRLSFQCKGLLPQ
jgi:hypothetical protein